MGAIAGIGGLMANGTSTYTDVGEFKINSKADFKRYVSSATKAGMAGVRANLDWTGTFKHKGHTPQALPGATLDLRGAISGSGATAVGLTGTCMVEEVKITVNIESGDPIECELTLSGNGALTFFSSGTSVTADALAALGFPSNAAKVALATPAASPSFADLDDVLSYTITIKRELKAYVSSSSAPNTKRVAGNWDASLSMKVLVADFTTLPDEDSVKHVRCYVTAALYWDFKWMRVAALNDLGANVESGEPVSPTIEFQMEAATDIGGTPTIGAILTPAGATVWPA